MGKFKQFLINLNESGFDNIPKTLEDINKLDLPNDTKNILVLIYKNFEKYFHTKWIDSLPITVNTNKNEAKIRRNFNLDILRKLIISEDHSNISVKLNKNSISIQGIIKITHGDGSRNNKAGGGKKGILFEQELKNDIENYSIDKSSVKYKNILDQLYTILVKDYKIDLLTDNYTVVQDGMKNQKRKTIWSKKGLTFNKTGNIGSVVTDLTILSNNKKAFLSLKYGSNYYLINTSIREYLKTSKKNNDEERNLVIKSFGFNPKKFLNAYGLESDDNSENSDTEIKKFWENSIKEIIGYGYIYIVSDGSRDIVMNNYKSTDVSVNKIIDIKYADLPKRKYSVIVLDVRLGKRNYKLSCQFRGTTSSDIYPYYLRALIS